MSYCARGNDILCSGNDGVYDVSFFAASIRHTIEQSRAVFEKISGRNLSEFGEVWKDLSEDDRQAFLLENHEFAHHALMFSTPAGVLNWRINQVISRDVQWILRKCHDYGVAFPEGVPPQKIVSTRSWQVSFKRRADVDRGTKRELFRTIASLEDIIRLRRVLFEPGAATNFADLTFGEMQELLKRSYAYLEERCEIRFCTDWQTKLPRNTKVFPDGKAFNLVDIAEVHAIAIELFILRAVGDLGGLNRRVQLARHGAYGAAFGIAVEATSATNDVGFSSHQMQMLSLISFSSALDIPAPTTKTAYLEDAMPWWRFASGEAFTAKTYIDALRNCLAIAFEPLIGQGSRWLQMTSGEWPLSGSPQLEKISTLMMSLSSLGLDRQIHAIHQGAKLNWRYLVTQLEQSFEGHHPGEFDRLSAEAWRSELQTAVLLVEYKDCIHFRYADYDELYPAGSFHRSSVKSLDRYGDPRYQLIGLILNGAIPRIMYAGYAGRLIPRLDILEPKLAAYFENPSLAADTISMLQTVLEGSAAVVGQHLTLLPKSVPLDRYI
jgi:hypothetical protein